VRRKIFGWLRNIINSAGIRLAAKKTVAARRRLTKFGAAALGSGAGLYFIRFIELRRQRHITNIRIAQSPL